MTDGDIAWVEYGGEHEAVYDLCVAETHNYVVSEAHIIVHNSGKTYGIAQGLNILVQSLVRELPQNEKFRITIMRKRMPSLKGTAMRDFFEIMQKYGWYDDSFHNKTDNEYHIGPVEIEFLSLDDPQKIRGRKRDIAWLNEANEFSFEDFKQINMRTTQKLILDYNPSDEYHWIYDNIEPRPETMFVKTTYKDNPFLSEEIIKEIEWLKQVDDNAWRVYGMGERGASGVNIYPSFEITADWPEEAESVYGLDFGHNNPSSLVEVKITEDEEYGKRLWVRQLMYEKKLTTQDIISRLEKLIDESWAPIYGDSSSPDRIDAIFRAGFNVKGADKRNYSVKDGIDFCKQHRIMVHQDSEDLIREIRGYKWRTDTNDRVLDEPVKFMDHALDAMRYAAYTHFANPITWLMA